MIRVLLSLLLALTLAATSVSSATMHAQMQGASEIAICSDTLANSGQTILTLDATGKPISRHNCPDCLAALSAVLLPGSVSIPARQTRSVILAIVVGRHNASRPLPAASARGPPLFV